MPSESMKPAYWYTADDRLATSVDPARVRQFRALMLYSAIYEEQFIVSDSYISTNRNLRKVLNEDKEIKKLLALGAIEIACREVDGRRVPLPETHTKRVNDLLPQIDSWENAYLAQGFPTRDEFVNGDDIETIEKVLEESQRGTRTYRLDAVGGLFTRNVGEHIAQLPEDALGDKEALIFFQEAVREEIAKGQAVNRSLLRTFFYQTLPRLAVERGLGLERWNIVAPRVKDIGDAFYLTSLPQFLNTNPLYPHEHAAAIDMVRGRRRPTLKSSGESKDFVIPSDISPQMFVRALLVLRAEDIEMLHKTPEWLEYCQAVKTLESRPAVWRAYQNYRRRVDEAIIERMGSDARAAQYTIQLDFGEFESMNGQEGLFARLIDHGVNEGITQAIDAVLGVTTLGMFQLLRTLFQVSRGSDPHTRGLQEGKDRIMDSEYRKLAVNDVLNLIEAEEPEGRILTRTRVATQDQHDTLLGVSPT